MNKLFSITLMCLFLSGCSHMHEAIIRQKNKQILQMALKELESNGEAIVFKNPPKEIIVLEHPNAENWQETYRCHKDHSAIVLKAPVSKTEADWDLIQIQYVQESVVKDSSEFDVETILSALPSQRKGKIVKLNIIDQGKDDVTYDLLSVKNISGQSCQELEVGRLYLRNNFFQHIAIVKMGSATDEERQGQLTLLKDYVFIMPFEGVSKGNLSLVDDVKANIHLTCDW